MKKSNKDSLEHVVIEDDFGSTNDLPDRDATISELAYYKAENRGFHPGHDLDDWLAAEQELD